MTGHPDRFHESGLAAHAQSIRATVRRFDEGTLAAAERIRDAEKRLVEATGDADRRSAEETLDAAIAAAPYAPGILRLLAVLDHLPWQMQAALPELVNDTNIARITDALQAVDDELNNYFADSDATHLTNALGTIDEPGTGLQKIHQALRRNFGYWQVPRGQRPGANLIADRDLSPERRDRLVGKLLSALQHWVPGSRAQLGGSIGSGPADDYSDIDICWVVPDESFTEANATAGAALSQCSGVLSFRTDPEFAGSARRRLVFARLYDMPLFWRVDIDIRADSVAADDLYDAGNPDARSDTRWSGPASAIEDAISAIKAAARGQADAADDLLRRGCERIGHDPGSIADLADAIINLADACATQDSDLTNIAAQVSQMADHLLRSEWSLEPRCLLIGSGEPAATVD